MNSEICKIVFVHLGTQIPPHLIKNLHRVKKLWPDRDTVLVTDIKVDFEGIEIFALEEDFTTAQLSTSALDSVFRQGFWRLTLARILALKTFHETCISSPLVHLESDVLVFPDFPFDQLATYSEVSWSRFNTTHDGGAVIFLRNFNVTERFVDRVREQILLDPSLTDMRALSILRNKYPKEYSLLPTSPPYPSDAIVRSDEYDDAMAKGFSHFKGIFDVAPLGMWLCGQDPRNYFGFSRRYQSVKGSAINVGNSYFRIDHAGRLRLVSADTSELAVFTLHVHSKKLSLFETFSPTTKADWAADSQLRRRPLTFSLRAFIYIVIDSRRTRTTLALIFALPGLRSLRQSRLLRRIFRRKMTLG